MLFNKIMAPEVLVLIVNTVIALARLSLAEENVLGGTWVNVYQDFDCSGESLNLTGNWKSRSDDTKKYNSGAMLDDTIKSVQGVGAWIFYTQGRFIGLSEVIHLKDDCVNLETTAGRVSSLRPVGGSPNYTEARFNLYGETDYNEVEIDIHDKQEYIKVSHLSIIIISNSSWTIYEKRDYQGHSTCLNVSAEAYMQVVGIPDHRVYNISDKAISSVKKGCNGTEDKIVHVKFEAQRTQISALVWWYLILTLGLLIIFGLLAVFRKKLFLCCARGFESCFSACFYRVYYFD